jgi:hypothetical protein
MRNESLSFLSCGGLQLFIQEAWRVVSLHIANLASFRSDLDAICSCHTDLNCFTTPDTKACVYVFGILNLI